MLNAVLGGPTPTMVEALLTRSQATYSAKLRKETGKKRTLSD